MTFEELKDKALSLPYEPGVYLMQDKSGQIIYVGKAKKLKNRVSQYFQDSSAHTPKTRKMVSQIDHFDVIVAASEFEALVLECSLIKRHMPKYNILLKDDKGYPYLRVDPREEYPVMELVSRVQDDGARYFGPYGGRSVTQNVIDTLRLCLKLPGCGKKFPRDIGKDRPCLNFHMNNCDGWCQPSRSAQEYRARMEQAVMMLDGKYGELTADLQHQMEDAAERLEFERAAALRDDERRLGSERAAKEQLGIAAMLRNPFRPWNMPQNQGTDFNDDIRRKQVDEDAVKPVGNAQNSLPPCALRQKMRNRHAAGKYRVYPRRPEGKPFCRPSGQIAMEKDRCAGCYICVGCHIKSQNAQYAEPHQFPPSSSTRFCSAPSVLLTTAPVMPSPSLG